MLTKICSRTCIFTHAPCNVTLIFCCSLQPLFQEPLAPKALQLTIQSPRIQHAGQAQLEGCNKRQVARVIG